MSDSTESSSVSDPSLGNDKVQADRKLLLDAQERGSVLGAYIRLSGPGWLQSAITLGGGSLAGALFLGVLGGTSMLWLQLLAIIMGVIMLSAISYVTLSTGRRPFEAINHEINPALGWGWLIATVMANIIWCMPQYSLCYDALDKNLASLFSEGGLGNDVSTKWTVSRCLFLAAGIVVLLNTKQGRAAKIFDIILKAMVGMVVICFFGVVVLLTVKGQLDFASIFSGFIPDLSQWNNPAGEMSEVVGALGADQQSYWTATLQKTQRDVMIAAAATAVGINMTFLLPYSMLARGWDKPFRGLARFDLATGMAIPYILVTSCVVVAAASTLHNKIDEKLASNDIEVMKESPYFGGVEKILLARIDHELGDEAESTSDEDKLAKVAALDVNEKKVALSLVKRNAFQLSETLEPLLGQDAANLVFGLGVFGMGFSTIVILMLINGYAFQEMFGPKAQLPFVVGCLVAGLSGESWLFLWTGDAKVWLAILTSTFGSMLLPIAYVTFFLMMNSRRILGDNKPKGFGMFVWNALMLFAVTGAIVAAYSAIRTKLNDPNPNVFRIIIGLLVVYAICVVVGFITRRPSSDEGVSDSAA